MLPAGGTSLLNVEQIIMTLEVEPDMAVADLGSGGNGHFVFPLSKTVGDGGTVYAVDIVKSDLESIDRHAKGFGITNVKTVWSNLEKVGATAIPELLDRAILINVIFQNKAHRDIIMEAARLLKPNGRLLVVDWQKGVAPFGPPEVDRVDTQTIISDASDARLTIVKQFRAGDFHFGLLFEKT